MGGNPSIEVSRSEGLQGWKGCRVGTSTLGWPQIPLVWVGVGLGSQCHGDGRQLLGHPTPPQWLCHCRVGPTGPFLTFPFPSSQAGPAAVCSTFRSCSQCSQTVQSWTQTALGRAEELKLAGVPQAEATWGFVSFHS